VCKNKSQKKEANEYALERFSGLYTRLGGKVPEGKHLTRSEGRGTADGFMSSCSSCQKKRKINARNFHHVKKGSKVFDAPARGEFEKRNPGVELWLVTPDKKKVRDVQKLRKRHLWCDRVGWKALKRGRIRKQLEKRRTAHGGAEISRGRGLHSCPFDRGIAVMVNDIRPRVHGPTVPRGKMSRHTRVPRKIHKKSGRVGCEKPLKAVKGMLESEGKGRSESS